jgi:DNA-directed RNA polymerase subunit RPC12/RpoP
LSGNRLQGEIGVVSAKIVIGYIISGVLLFFAVIFALASAYAPIRLATSAFLFLAGFGTLYYIRKQQPIHITQKLEVPGKVKVQTLRCPNCSASLDIGQVKVIKGVPSIKCSYCGHIFEVTEEPKW